MVSHIVEMGRSRFIFIWGLGQDKVLYHKGIANGAEIYLPLF
jgi:hypothetical protein